MAALLKYLGLLALLLFFLLLGGRALMLRKKGIRAIVFGETDKSDFLLVPILLVFLYAVLAGSFDLPMPRALARPFWGSAAAGWGDFRRGRFCIKESKRRKIRPEVLYFGNRFIAKRENVIGRSEKP